MPSSQRRGGGSEPRRSIRALFPRLAPALGAMAVTGVATAAWGYRRLTALTVTAPASSDDAHLRNPFELREALLLGVLYGVVLVVTRAAQARLGAGGLYASAVLAALTDVDAVTLSVARPRSVVDWLRRSAGCSWLARSWRSRPCGCIDAEAGRTIMDRAPRRLQGRLRRLRCRAGRPVLGARRPRRRSRPSDRALCLDPRRAPVVAGALPPKPRRGGGRWWTAARRTSTAVNRSCPSRAPPPSTIPWLHRLRREVEGALRELIEEEPFRRAFFTAG
jgi:hypothetical protein